MKRKLKKTPISFTKNSQPDFIKKRASNFQLVFFFIITLFVSSPALASYKDGFFALVIIFFSLPVVVIGITIMFFMVSTEKFKQLKTYQAYRNTWMTLLVVSGIGLFMMAFDGDPTSSIAIVICWIIYGLILILPATIQSKRSNKNEVGIKRDTQE